MLRTLIYSLALLFAADAFAAEPAKPAPPKRIGWGNFPPDNQAKLLLWPEGAPGALGKEEADTPWLWLYPAPADKANGAAVVVCPGGGYGGLAIGHEGNDVAKWWNSLGVSAYVLKYRVAPYKHPVPLGDVQRAIRLVRSKADEWKLDPKRIGVMGFSAGGHLASSLATHFDDGQTDSKDPIDATGCRPDFAVLCYPVITFTQEQFMHAGSRRNLLGDKPDPELVKLMSSELQVTDKAPPTFLFHTAEDTGVPPENSVFFFQALRAAKVPAEMHIYQRGRHGVGLASDDAVLNTWTGRLKDWMMAGGWLNK
ncbi:MAG: alpha/beta hydrolase [Planctomycetales bacterium]|nr:alpha/beta hydrolase [Planctomycetales bacterium]